MKVMISSSALDNTGYAEFARSWIKALNQHPGIDLALDLFSLEPDRAELGEIGKTINELSRKKLNPDVNIITMIPPVFERFKKPGCKNIGLTMFESTVIPETWTAACNKMDGILVPASWNKEVFRSCGVKVPIEVVMPSIETSEKIPDLVRTKPFKFLAVGQFIPRKNYDGLIKAYWAAFTGRDDVELTIKTYRKNRSADENNEISKEINSIKSSLKLKHYPKLNVITATLSSAEMTELHKNSNCFVLIPKAEGFGLPFAQAMAQGKPVIATGFSGQTEFMNEKNSFLVKHNLTPTTNAVWFHQFFEGTGFWAEAHLDDLIDKMKSVVDKWDDSMEAKRVQAFNDIKTRCNTKQIGQDLVEAIKRIIK